MHAALNYGGTQAPGWLQSMVIADRFGLDPVVIRRTWSLADQARACAYLRNLPNKRG